MCAPSARYLNSDGPTAARRGAGSSYDVWELGRSDGYSRAMKEGFGGSAPSSISVSSTAETGPPRQVQIALRPLPRTTSRVRPLSNAEQRAASPVAMLNGAQRRRLERRERKQRISFRRSSLAARSQLRQFAPTATVRAAFTMGGRVTMLACAVAVTTDETVRINGSQQCAHLQMKVGHDTAQHSVAVLLEDVHIGDRREPRLLGTAH